MRRLQTSPRVCPHILQVHDVHTVAQWDLEECLDSFRSSVVALSPVWSFGSLLKACRSRLPRCRGAPMCFGRRRRPATGQISPDCCVAGPVAVIARGSTPKTWELAECRQSLNCSRAVHRMIAGGPLCHSNKSVGSPLWLGSITQVPCNALPTCLRCSELPRQTSLACYEA